MSAPQTKNELTCEICIDIITDLDNWLTSDKTEQEIVDFMKEVKLDILNEKNFLFLQPKNAMI